MKVAVALCTFNGERYLRAQLTSIAEQTRLPDELVICDDGSTDSTCSIINTFAASSSFPTRVYLHPENQGVVANFVGALKLCSGDLIAFCDQDDIWMPDKLARACVAIERTDDPLRTLLFSRLEYVDASLSRIGMSQLPKIIGFNNAIVENIATGCSVMVGSEIRDLMLRGTPDDMLMHDWWAYLVASAFGSVIYDPTPSVRYRQHAANVTGWERRPQKIWNRTRGLVRRLLTTDRGIDALRQAERFVQRYPDLGPDKANLVRELVQLREVGLLTRARYALHPRVARNDAIEHWGLKVMLLMGWH